MKFRIRFNVISLLCALLSFFLFAQAASAVTYTVNVSDNSLNGHANADPDEETEDIVSVSTNGKFLRIFVNETKVAEKKSAKIN